jgi:anti-sigma factor ChrR (cupin superfamily)
MPDLVNADFSKRVVIDTNVLPWQPSPQPGVERRLLDRIGGEVARATSLVRYAPDSAFTPHQHELGEEFLVLEGVFSDEHGDYPVGAYVRNPPGSVHSPRTEAGCTILVKLRQMQPSESGRLVLDTSLVPWERCEANGHYRRRLHGSDDTGEVVTLDKLDAATMLNSAESKGGEEIFLLSGILADDLGRYRPGTWIRNPAGFRNALSSQGGAVFWAKRGHLRQER